MLEAILSSKAGQSFGGNLGKGLGDALGGGGPLVSGAQVDGRGFLDGSGWTVSTGASRATGGTSGGLSAPGTAPNERLWGAAAPQQAGYGWIGAAVLLMIAAGLVLRGGWR